MSRNYARVSPRFWSGETGRQLRQLGVDSQLLALYLLTCPSANMNGLYYLPLPIMGHETGIGPDRCLEILADLRGLGFAVYDDNAECVFVVEMARHQIEDTLGVRDNRRISVLREIERIRSTLVALFVERYGKAFNLDAGTYPPTCHWRAKPSTVAALIKRDGATCRTCGTANGLTVDHVRAKINGGTNELDNLQLLCLSCNSRKAAEDRRLFWESVDLQARGVTPLEALTASPCSTPSEGDQQGQPAPLQKVTREPSESQDQEQDSEQEQKVGGHGRAGRAPAAPASLSLTGIGDMRKAPEDLTARQRLVWDALEAAQFYVPGKGDTCALDVVPDPAALVRALGGPAYPNVDAAGVIHRLAAWTQANRSRAKHDLARFLAGRFRAEQDNPRASAQPSTGGAAQQDLAAKLREAGLS
jgi:hypothetical protein